MILSFNRSAVLYFLLVVAIVLALIVLVLSNINPIEAEEHENGTRFYQYAAKFVCGAQSVVPLFHAPKEPPVKPGNYATAINVHNPHENWIVLQKKAVLALVEPNQGKPGPWVNFELGPDGAFEIDCPDIIKLLGDTLTPHLPFIKGFVVIRTQYELDVVGVYTAGSKALVNSIDVEEITPKIVVVEH